MGERTEGWANVYEFVTGQVLVGKLYPNRKIAAIKNDGEASFRIHVRLKPEGAPRRYASEAERHCWNTWPADMRQGRTLADMLGPAYARAAQSPRTPKIEESAS